MQRSPGPVTLLVGVAISRRGFVLVFPVCLAPVCLKNWFLFPGPPGPVAQYCAARPLSGSLEEQCKTIKSPVSLLREPRGLLL